MKIMVCIKEVPNVSQMKLDPETNNLIREGTPMIINPVDLNALEEALKIKSENGAEVSVITMGLASAKDSLRECVAMGADKGYLLNDDALVGSDTLATSYALAKAIESIDNFDIIFTGTQALDGDTGQVGPEIAENLNFAQATYVSNVALTEDGALMAYRNYNNGTEDIKLTLPALVTVTKGGNTPRKPTIKTKMAAKKAEFPIVTCESAGIDEEKVGVKGSATSVVDVYPPKQRDKGFMIEEASEEASVAKLVDILVTEKLF